MKEPLTQNLGDKLREATGSPPVIRPEQGIDIIETTIAKVKTRAEEMAEKAEAIAQKSEDMGQDGQPWRNLAESMKKLGNLGDKNNEAEGTAAKNNSNSMEKNIMSENGQVQETEKKSPRGRKVEKDFDEQAMELVERAIGAAEKLAKKGIILEEKPRKRNMTGSVLVGAGVGCVVGGAAGGCVAGFIPASATTQDVLVGTAVGAGIGSVVGAAGGAIYASGEDEPKKSKKKSKKDDDDSDD